MGISSQRKGRSAEIELSRILQDYGYAVKPGDPVSYGETPDLTGLPGIHIECKRCEQLRLSEWMKQAEKDAARFSDGLPIIFHRRNREPWNVTMRLSVFMKIYVASRRGR
jgi:Holliday junction resolvase